MLDNSGILLLDVMKEKSNVPHSLFISMKFDYTYTLCFVLTLEQ